MRLKNWKKRLINKEERKKSGEVKFEQSQQKNENDIEKSYKCDNRH